MPDVSIVARGPSSLKMRFRPGLVGPPLAGDDFATQAEAEAGTNAEKVMSPLRTAQQTTARLAGQAVAEAGADNDKLMSPLRTKQSIDVNAKGGDWQATGSSNVQSIDLKLRETVSVLDFMTPTLAESVLARTTTSADKAAITAATQDAIDETGDDGELLFPAGKYYLDSDRTIRIRNGSITLKGDGGATDLIVSGAGDTFSVHTDAYTEIFHVRFERFVVNESAKTGGCFVSAERVGQLSFLRMFVDQPWDVIKVHNINNLDLTDLQWASPRGTAAVRISGGGTADVPRYGVQLRTDVVKITNYRSGSSAGDDIVIDGFVASVDILGLHSVNPGGRTLHVRNTIGATHPNEFLQAINMQSDSPVKECVRFDVGRRQNLVGCLLFGSEEESNIFVANGCEQTQVIGGFSRGARKHGLEHNGSGLLITAANFSENSSENNPIGGANHGIYSGVYLGPTSTKVEIRSNRCGDAGSSNWQKAGIETHASATNFAIDGNNVQDNISGITNAAGSSATKRVGFNTGAANASDQWRASSSTSIERRTTNGSTGTSVVAREVLETGTVDSFVQFQLVDNSGSPYGQISGGAALTRFYYDNPRHSFRDASGATFMEMGAALGSYANDAAAAAGGLPLHGYYHNSATGGVSQRRV